MESEVAGLRDFLGSELYEWLQDDALDTCDREASEASEIRGRRRPALDRNNTDITHLSMIIDIYKTAKKFNIKMT